MEPDYKRYYELPKISANEQNEVHEGIKRAVVEAMVTVMMNNQQGPKTPEYIQNSIYLDSEVMARAVTKAQQKIDYRFNPTPQF